MKSKRNSTRGKTPVNTGKPYELLVKQLIEGLSKIQGKDISDVKVEHDVDLQGNTQYTDGSLSKHQIDVFWQFRLAGTLYQIVIQAKNLQRRIELSQVLTLCCVLRDLPAHHQGLIITTKGFQKSALEFGQAHGIQLCLLREPNDIDFPRGKPGFTAKVHTIQSSFSKVKTDCLFHSSDSSVMNQLLSQTPENIKLWDLAGNYRGTLIEPMNQAAELHRKSMLQAKPGIKNFTLSFTFEEPIILNFGSTKHPAFIKKVTFELQAERLPSVTLQNAISQIFELVTGDDTYWMDENGTVRQKGEPVTVEHTFQTSKGPLSIRLAQPDS